MYFPISRWDTASEIARDFDDLFSGLSGAVHALPAVNIWANENEAILTAELPGVEPDEVQIDVTGNALTLRGVRKAYQPKQGEVCHRSECVCGEFNRAIQLPFRIDSEKVAAQFKRGVLTVSVPRAEADKPRKIQIKAA